MIAVRENPPIVKKEAITEYADQDVKNRGIGYQLSEPTTELIQLPYYFSEAEYISLKVKSDNKWATWADRMIWLTIASGIATIVKVPELIFRNVNNLDRYEVPVLLLEVVGVGILLCISRKKLSPEDIKKKEILDGIGEHFETNRPKTVKRI